MPAESLFADLVPTDDASTRQADNYVKQLRILDIYAAGDDIDSIPRIMMAQQGSCANTLQSQWMCYMGHVKPDASGQDNAHEDLESYHMYPLIDKQPWTDTGTYDKFYGVEGVDPFWDKVEEVLRDLTPEERAQIMSLQLHISIFRGEDVNTLEHGLAAASSLPSLPQLQIVGVTYWAQLANAEDRTRSAALRFGQQFAERYVSGSGLVFVSENDAEAPRFLSDYKYSVKRSMVSMICGVTSSARIDDVCTPFSMFHALVLTILVDIDRLPSESQRPEDHGGSTCSRDCVEKGSPGSWQWY